MSSKFTVQWLSYKVIIYRLISFNAPINGNVSTYHDNTNVQKVPEGLDELPLEVRHLVEFFNRIEYEEQDEYRAEHDVEYTLVPVLDQLEGVYHEGRDDSARGWQLEQKSTRRGTTYIFFKGLKIRSHVHRYERSMGGRGVINYLFNFL